MLSGFLHFIWLGGAPNFAAWMGIKKWSRACVNYQDLNDKIYPILWINREAFHAIHQERVAEEIHASHASAAAAAERHIPTAGYRTHGSKYYIFQPTEPAKPDRIFLQSQGIQICGYMFGYYAQLI